MKLPYWYYLIVPVTYLAFGLGFILWTMRRTNNKITRDDAPYPFVAAVFWPLVMVLWLLFLFEEPYKKYLASKLEWYELINQWAGLEYYCRRCGRPVHDERRC